MENEKLRKRIKWLIEDLKREKDRRKDIEFKYKDLKKTSLLFAKDVALLLHYKKYMELYEDLFTQTQTLYQAHIHKYDKLFKDFEQKFSTDEYSKKD